jgi:hypothetical protein
VLAKHLLAHEIAHLYFRKIYLVPMEDGFDMDKITSTSFGMLYAVRDENGADYPSSENIDLLMHHPFTPYLRTRANIIYPLYQNGIEKANEFLYEYGEYFEEFFAEAAALSKNKNPEEMNEVEEYFVRLYEETEASLYTQR